MLPEKAATEKTHKYYGAPLDSFPVLKVIFYIFDNFDSLEFRSDADWLFPDTKATTAFLILLLLEYRCQNVLFQCQSWERSNQKQADVAKGVKKSTKVTQ